MTSEWVDWHRRYETERPLRRRLELVQERIRAALDGHDADPFRVISLCAGDGRDLLGVLADHPRATRVRARLVELTPELAAAARESATRLGLPGIEVVQGDAALARAYRGAVPADLVLACGIFGNVTGEDIRHFVAHLPELCAPGATVVWTRGRFAPDLTPAIRGWFRESGFEEVLFSPIAGSTASVGAHRLVGPARPLDPDVRLFTFLPPGKRPSYRHPAGPRPTRVRRRGTRQARARGARRRTGGPVRADGRAARRRPPSRRAGGRRPRGTPPGRRRPSRR
jgi:hypothetical protein